MVRTRNPLNTKIISSESTFKEIRLTSSERMKTKIMTKITGNSSRSCHQPLYGALMTTMEPRSTAIWSSIRQSSSLRVSWRSLLNLRFPRQLLASIWPCNRNSHRKLLMRIRRMFSIPLITSTCGMELSLLTRPLQERLSHPLPRMRWQRKA